MSVVALRRERAVASRVDELARASGRGGIVRSFQPKFYDRRTGEEARSIVALLAGGSAPELDYGALNLFLRTGLFLGDSTPFRDIKARLPEIPLVKPATLTRAQAIAGYIDLFRQAMGRALGSHPDEDFVMGLSGGRDSRHIFLEALAQGRKPRLCWTVDLPWNPDEAVIAKRLAARGGVEQCLIAPAAGLDAERRKNALTNFATRQHAWILGALDIPGPVRHQYDGIAGDILSESSLLNQRDVELVERGRLEEFVDGLLPDVPLPLIADRSLFPGREDAKGRLLNELSRHLATANPLASFYFWNRTRRDIGESAFSLLSGGGRTMHAPFLDDDLFAFLASLPAQLTLKTYLHSEVIRVAYPEFADIPYAAGNGASKPARATAVQALSFLVRNRPALVDNPKTILRLVRSLLSPKHRGDADWIMPGVVYLHQLRQGAAL